MSNDSSVRVHRLKPLVRAAIQNGNSGPVEDYLAKGGEINARDQLGRTPLMLAASKGHTLLCQLLLDRGADCSAHDTEGRTALEIARREGAQDVALLIELQLHLQDQNPIPVEPDVSVSGLFEALQPEVQPEAPIEDAAVRVQVLDSQGVMQAPPPIDRDSDWNDLEIDLPDVDGLAIGRELQRQDIQELFAALIGEARERGAFRQSLVANLAVELNGSVDGDVFQNISQILRDIGCIPEEDEVCWGHGCPIGEEWRSDDFTEDCIGYLQDLLSRTNDPYRHLTRDVQLSILLDREGEERIGRQKSLAVRDACDAIASDDRVLSVLVNLDRQVEKDALLAGRLSRLEVGVEENFELPSDGEEEDETTVRTGEVDRFRLRLAEAILAYRETAHTERKKKISDVVGRLELTHLGFRAIQDGLAAAGVENKQLNGALERATRLDFEMFLANVRLAIFVAGKYGWSKLPRMDRIQEAYIGLMKAIDKFDFDRGFKFSTYATWWLKQSVTRAIADKERTIRVPVHMLDRVKKLASAARDLGFETASDIPISELSSVTQLSEAEVLKALSVVEDPEILEDSPEALASVMSLADDDECPLAFAERIEMQRIVRECVELLPDREADVIKHRFGLTDTGEKTLEEVGKLYDVTRERIRQIESKALEKLRKQSNRIFVLEDYVSECR
jgi:RNA polymerase primary sigma factor